MKIYYKAQDRIVYQAQRGDVVLLGDALEFCKGYLIGFTNVSHFEDITPDNLRNDFMHGDFRLEMIADDVYAIILNTKRFLKNNVPLKYLMSPAHDFYVWNSDELKDMLGEYGSRLPGSPERPIHSVWVFLASARNIWGDKMPQPSSFIETIFNKSQKSKDGYNCDYANFYKAWERATTAGIFYVNCVE